MGILFNANSTPAMNDVSVTSGNADGWVYAGQNSLEGSVPRPVSDQSSRRTADGGSSASAKSGKPRNR